MTVTRLWQAGFETGTLEEGIGGVIVGVPLASTEDKYTGAYSMKVNGFGKYLIIDVPATNQVRASMWMKNTYDFWSGADQYIFSFYNDSTFIAGFRGQSANLHIDANGSLQDTVGYYGTDWVHYSVNVKIDASSGWLNVYKDGNATPVLAYAGDTDISSLQINKVRILHYNSPVIGGQGSSYMDDIYIDDTTGEASANAPILRFYHVVPSGAGNYAEFDPSTGTNYSCVDEIPPSDADYVSTATAGEYDSYAMNSITLGAGQEVAAVIPIAYVKRGADSEEIALGTRYSSANLVGSDQSPGAALVMLSERQTTKPGGGAWDQTSIDGFEALIMSSGTY